MSETYPVSAQNTPSRLSGRVSYDRAAVHAVLDEAVVCHVGFVVDGLPIVLPQLHARVGETLLLHGSSGARAMRAAHEGGLAVCVTVTLVDGLVLARSAFNHSINYRSVVVHATAFAVTDELDKQAALSALVDSVVPGRSDAVRGASRKELAATSVLRLDLDSVSLKVRSGPPVDDDDDLALPYWAGVVPISTTPGAPEASPDLAASIATPEHVSALGATRAMT